MNKNYSSFSQMKGLLYMDWYKRIMMNDFAPPVGAIIDLTDMCNLKCEWCNSQNYRSKNTLKKEHVIKILDDLSHWGVHSVCFAGGGEPTLHPDFSSIIEHARRKRLQVGVSTNGIPLNGEKIKTIVDNAYFCGVSVDAGKRETYKELKKCDEWSLLETNCRTLTAMGKKNNLDTTYKFLISQGNQFEIVEACKNAKQWGFKNFFVRPAAYENIPGIEFVYKFDGVGINLQLERCRDMEDDHFTVYGNFGRVDKKMRAIHPYPACKASPLAVVMCADGYCYLCIDKRERPEARMCRHEEIRSYWNSKAHHDMIDNIKVEQCPRCTFGNYNEQFDCIINDTFAMWFP